ncbi:MAG: VOC family protein [Gammaproteobacteria bacterium]
MINSISIKKLDHVVIRARDLEKLVSFYCDVLGCSLERRSFVVDGLVHLRAGICFVDIQQGGDDYEPPQAGLGNQDHFCLQVEPFTEEEMTAYLESHGVDIGEFAQRFGSDGDGISVYLRDPEGNEVELKAGPAPT